MPSSQCDRAIADALKFGCAILKSVSANDVGLTGSNQRGFYLPKEVWTRFSPFPPDHGVNYDHGVTARWADGRVTQSHVKWYGKSDSKNEYRLTSFNRERRFPYRTHDRCGSLLVLVPESLQTFHMHMLDDEEDIIEIQAILGVETISGWGLYEAEPNAVDLDETKCLDARILRFAESLSDFPDTRTISQEARESVRSCVKDFDRTTLDNQLVQFVEQEYRLFRSIERKISGRSVFRRFDSIEEFLKTAQSILQRRKSRAGRSLENHVEHLLETSKLDFEAQPLVDGTRPDFLIPGTTQYVDRNFSRDRLMVLAVKTTCRDRWRQVLREAPSVPRKYILTLQPGNSPAQLDEMKAANVTLVVPEAVHGRYPKAHRGMILTIEKFIDRARTLSPI